MAANPPAPGEGRPNPGTLPSKQSGLTGLGGLGGDPIPPETGKTSFSQAEVIRRILKTPRGKKFAKFGLLANIATARSVDPVGLLLAAIGRDVPATSAAFNKLANMLREGMKDPLLGGDVAKWVAKTGGDPTVVNRVSANAKVQGYQWSWPQTVPQKVTSAAELAAGKEAQSNPWIVAVKDKSGKIVALKEVKSVSAPKDALTQFGSPVRKNEFSRAFSGYTDYFTKYIGRKPTVSEVAGIISRGLSEGGVINMLSKSPSFKRGQIWQASAPSIIGYAKSLMGEGYKVDAEFIRKAIVNNWNEGTLRRKLIEKPEYLNGPEFRQNTSSLQNVYSQIMGRPDEAAVQGIKEAALGGWSSDQYAAYLRAQPQYAKGQEYKSKAMSFLEQLGMLTGQRATDFDVGMLGTPPPTPGADTNTPYSPRLSPTSPNAAAGYTPSAPVLTKNKAGTQQVAHPAPAKKPGKPGFRPF